MPLSSDDIAAIQQLNARYAHAMDSGDSSAWAACFAREGEFVSAGGKAITGVAALERFASDAAAAAAGTGRRHWLTNLLVDGDGNRATSRAYGALVQTIDGETAISASFVYHDDLVVEDGAWKFARRSSVIDR